MDNYKTVIRKITDLTPYENNSRTHSEEQIQQVMNSIKEFGFTNPPIIDENNNVLAGHGRLEAAQNLGFVKVNCVQTTGLSNAQKKAYVIADNQIALNAEWDLDLLKIEIDSLNEEDFNIDILGFDFDFITDLFTEESSGDDNPYSTNIDAPTYEPNNKKPKLTELIALDKTDELIAKIKSSKVSAKEKTFLLAAAERHTIFDFSNIADYYAHSNKEMQGLMEDSALVIIDYNKALEAGFIRVSKAINDQCKEDDDEG